MRKYFVIVNPVSGRGAGERAIPQLETSLRSQVIDYALVRTKCPWNAADLAQSASADGVDVVVAVGGDGTANEVLNGLMADKAARGHCATMGVVSVGRGNDFAFGIGAPHDLDAAVHVLSSGRVRTIDIGRAVGGDVPQGRYFGNGVGIGFDTIVGFEAAKLKRVHGFPAYLLGALKTIFLYFRAPRLTIELDARTLSQRSLLVSVMNGRRMGGGFYMAPQGRPDDGVFDLCIAGQVSRLGVLRLMPRFMNGTQGSHAAITMERSRRVRVVAEDGALPAHADGETLCVAGHELTIELLPKRIDVLVPQEGTPA